MCSWSSCIIRFKSLFSLENNKIDLRCILHMTRVLAQLRRMAVYDQFCGKSAAVLFATDIAARGLDFPNIDWVMQVSLVIRKLRVWDKGKFNIWIQCSPHLFLTIHEALTSCPGRRQVFLYTYNATCCFWHFMVIYFTRAPWLQASSLSRGTPTLWLHMCIINDALCVIYDAQWPTVWLWQFWSFGRFLKGKNMVWIFLSIILLYEWCTLCTVRYCASFMTHCASSMTQCITVRPKCWQSSIEDACSQL